MIAALAGLVLRAATPLRQAWTPVPADSVMFWDSEWGNLRQTALAADATLRPRALAAVAGRKAFRQLADRWERDVAARMNPAGGADDVRPSEQAYYAAAALEASAGLLLATGDGRYAEPVERMAANLLPALATDDADLPQRRAAAQAMLSAAGTLFATTPGGMAVNVYANCYARMRVDSLPVALDVMTGMPHDARVKVRVGLPHGSHRLTLRLRLPLWARGTTLSPARFRMEGPEAEPPVCYVNGREENLPVVDGYIVVTRDWNNGDEVYFDLPLVPRLVREVAAGAEAGRVALVRGPLLYVPAGDGGEALAAAAALPEALDEPGPLGHVVLGRGADGPRMIPYADARMAGLPVAAWLPVRR